MHQPILLTLLLAASAHAATKYIFTSAIPIVETPLLVSAPSASTTIIVPVSSSAPSASSSLVYTSEVAPFPTAAGTGASAPVGTGSGSASATGTGAPITPAIPYKGAAARNTGTLFGGVVALGAVALALC
ncbi:hypothetical protein HO133_001043 [Letharia lupina]|uniref:Uncharacterized protein n=1 Tax=Letharia lupina TaxID=560253 RepID=A0A8H6CGA5_9LECA|nr:uncharacterized protein HO133_001043 [Letharia lupina]KAF6222992.1 hypothetical protein HO133_001043 [Letharia lupina]